MCDFQTGMAGSSAVTAGEVRGPRSRKPCGYPGCNNTLTGFSLKFYTEDGATLLALSLQGQECNNIIAGQ